MQHTGDTFTQAISNDIPKALERVKAERKISREAWRKGFITGLAIAFAVLLFLT